MDAHNWQILQDEELLKMYLKGHFEAFEYLYARHKGGSYRFILRQVNTPDVAEDLMQELWIKVVSQRRRFNNNSKFSTWLYQMARNLLIDRFRHLEVVSNVIVQGEEGRASDNSLDVEKGRSLEAEQALLKARQNKALKHCLQKLPKAQLESFLLKEEAAMSQSDIALVLDASLEATKSRLRTAYSNLRECLQLNLGERNE